LYKPSILLTVDVEDWFQVENLKQSIPFSAWSSHEYRVEKNTHRLLDLLDSIDLDAIAQCSTSDHGPPAAASEPPKSAFRASATGHPHATFFVLGWLAQRCPQLIREIHTRQHEIASHGLYHSLPNECSLSDFRTDLADSRKVLEDTTGDTVHGYRTPSFAIDNRILTEIENCGYSYDSSYNSFGAHGRYGRLNGTWGEKRGIALQISPGFHELPVSNLNAMNHVLPWGGGGYFRLMPLPLFRLGVAAMLKEEGAYLFYMHPWEIDPDQPRVSDAPLLYKLRHYVNLRSTYPKLARLISSFSHCRFITCRQYLDEMEAGDE